MIKACTTNCTIAMKTINYSVENQAGLEETRKKPKDLKECQGERSL